MTSLKIDTEPHKVSQTRHIAYRPDIDGLRALAVLLVVIFHAFPSTLAGGFIGVDIFFVISGYLISSILIKDLTHSRFSIFTFYQSRITRIFPALILVLFSSLTFGWLALLQEEYISLAKHALSGAGFVSNLTLWSEASYFDVAAETKPLLHLWSLGVEEQFYLFWPAILLLLWKSGKRLTGLILILIMASFALNMYQSTNNPTADFYSPLTRFWELLAGALIAANARKINFKQRTTDYISVGGFLLLLIGLVTITSKDNFPGSLALIPVSGTVMLIASGELSIVNRTILSNRLLVGIGLISYPLYLWHWPLLSFSRIVQSETPSLAIRWAALAIAVFMAVTTYKLVETPIRNGSINRKASTLILCGAMVAIMAFSMFAYIYGGFPSRTGSNPVLRHPAELGRDPYLNYITNNFNRCTDPLLLKLSVLDTSYGHRCFQSQKNAPIQILLLGDSHAEHWLPGLSDQLKDVNVGSLIQPDLPSIDSKLFKDAIPAIANNASIKTVIISAMWIDKINQTIDNPTKQLQKTIKLLTNNGKYVYVFDDVPSYDFTPEKCMYGRRFSTNTETCEISISQYKTQKRFYSESLTEAVKGNPFVTFVPVSDFLCDPHECNMLIDDILVYRDTNHLNITGSKLIMRKIMQSGLTFHY